MSEPADPAPPSLSSAQLQDRAVRGVAWTMVNTVVSIPVAFVVNLLLARVLAPEGYGRLAFLTTLIGIAGSLIALGLSSAMIQFGARAHAAGRVDEVRRILSASQGFRLLVVAPALTLLVLVLVDAPTSLLVLAVLFGIWAPAALDGAVITLSIENKSASAARIAMASNLIVQAGVVAVVLWVGTADSVWAARVVLSAGVIAMSFAVISPAYRRAVLRPRLPRGFPEGFWRFALPTGAAALIAELALSRTEVVLLGWLSNPADVGWFALAFGVSAHIFGPAQALTGPLIPAVSGLKEVGVEHVAEAFARTLRAVALVIGLLTAGALPSLAALVPLLYGEAYAPAASALLVMGLVTGLGVVIGPVTAFVMARLSARRLLWASSCALAVDVLVAVATIPSLGMWGAVLANASAVAVHLSILLESERKDLGVRFSAVLRMLAPTVLASLSCGIAWIVILTAGWGPVASAVVASILATGLLWAGITVTNSGLTAADRDAIVRNLPARLSPLAQRVLRHFTQRRAR